MQLLYNSDSFAVLQIEFGLPDASAEGGGRDGYEIVDKFARKGIFLEGAVAQGFKVGVQALIETSALIRELPTRARTRAEDYIDRSWLAEARATLSS